jgi:ABC-type multidrug transport system ATPase subunit
VSDTEAVVSLLQALPRRARGTNLAPIDLSLGAGVHAVVGTPADGTTMIAGLVGGFEPRHSGRVLVAGRDPSVDPLLRGRIGATLDVPQLPSAPRVRDLLVEVDRVRGTRIASEALDAFSLSHWADRKISTLSRWETRALDLVLALSATEPLALALTEPGADVAPLDRQVLRSALWNAAEMGACVIVATASMSDAVELAGTIHIFERGRITRWVPVDETGALLPGRGIELRVEVDLPRLLVAALADEPSVVGIDWDEQRHRSLLSIRGADLDRMALALARAAIASGASVRSIAPVAPQLDEVRAAASGLALAAYHAAYQQYARLEGEPHAGTLDRGAT